MKYYPTKWLSTLFMKINCWSFLEDALSAPGVVLFHKQPLGHFSVSNSTVLTVGTPVIGRASQW